MHINQHQMSSYMNDTECSWPGLNTLGYYMPRERSETIIILNEKGNMIMCRSQQLRGLRCRSATDRLLRLWVRIPLGAWMSIVNVVCCQVEVSVMS